MDNNKNVISDGSDTDNNIHSFVFWDKVTLKINFILLRRKIDEK